MSNILKYQNPSSPLLVENNKAQGGTPGLATTEGFTPKPLIPVGAMLIQPESNQEVVEETVVNFPKDENERVKFWMDKFAKYGLTPKQQIALIAAMKPECELNPQGSVNKHELKHGLGTKGGWAHAGEGTVHFTHWNTKKKYIDLFNSDPRRTGETVTNVESEYADPNTKHIADLNYDDHALFTYLYYEPLLERTKNMSFNDMMAEFYLQKAGRKYAVGPTSYDKAVSVGQHYQKVHEKQGFTKAAQHNNFIKSLNYAKTLAKRNGVAL